MQSENDYSITRNSNLTIRFQSILYFLVQAGNKCSTIYTNYWVVFC